VLSKERRKFTCLSASGSSAERRIGGMKFFRIDIRHLAETAASPLECKWPKKVKAVAGVRILRTKIILHLATLACWGILALVATKTNVLGQPILTRQPTNQSVSLGASAAFSVTGSGTPPLLYQWRLVTMNLASATNSSLTLTNVQLVNAGNYSVVLTDSAGSVTSKVAVLSVDSAFTKIVAGDVVSERGEFYNCAWVDFDNDGYLDLFAGASGGTDNHLYHNNRDGTFTKVPLKDFPPSGNQQHGGVWADFNNDGYIDLLVTGGQYETGSPGSFRNVLYQNSGDGTFRKITNGIFATEIGQFHAAAWVDFDRDGLVDLFITSHGASADQPPAKNRLYHNNGDGTFTKITDGPVVNDPGDYLGRAWADYDNDGWPDLFVPDFSGARNHLYHNDGSGQFSAVTQSIVAKAVGSSGCAAWADYDNDGYLDLFVVNTDMSKSGNLHNYLYHNEGNGTFTQVTQGSLVLDTSLGGFVSCAWGDYDNDGFIDVITSPTDATDGRSYLYHNIGDGTFTKIEHGSVTSDRASRPVYAWGDYDRDGFLDLFVAQGGGFELSHPTGTPLPVNSLYHNNGNSNAWINIKLIGTVSNRSAIGAKVRVKAFYRGASRWQLREITAGDGNGTQQPLNTHFGLGDAANIDLVRIEWPSGIVQTMTNAPVKQFLTVTEPPRLSAVAQSDGPRFWLKGGLGFQYQIETSSDLAAWSPIGLLTITNATGVAKIEDLNPLISNQRYYRAVSQ
jgi:hypothetical protein